MYILDQDDAYKATAADIEHVRRALIKRGNLVDLLVYDLPPQTDRYGCERHTAVALELLKLPRSAQWAVGHTFVAEGYSYDNADAARAARWRLLCIMSRCTVYYPLDLGAGWRPGLVAPVAQGRD